MTSTLDELARQLENENIAQAYDMGRDTERAAVVAWLRAQGMAPYAQGNLDYAATMIERGEHRREEKP